MNTFVKVRYEGNHSVSVGLIDSKELEPDLKFFYKHIDTDMVEFVYIDDDIQIIVDEEGLLKTNNPVMEVTIGEHSPLQLAGIIVFGKSVMSNEGIKTVGFSDEEELKNFVESIRFRILGFVK